MWEGHVLLKTLRSYHLLLVCLAGLLAGQWEHVSLLVSDVMPQSEQKKNLASHLTQLGLKGTQMEFKGSVRKVCLCVGWGWVDGSPVIKALGS